MAKLVIKRHLSESDEDLVWNGELFRYPTSALNIQLDLYACFFSGLRNDGTSSRHETTYGPTNGNATWPRCSYGNAPTRHETTTPRNER